LNNTIFSIRIHSPRIKKRKYHKKTQLTLVFVDRKLTSQVCCVSVLPFTSSAKKSGKKMKQYIWRHAKEITSRHSYYWHVSHTNRKLYVLFWISLNGGFRKYMTFNQLWKRTNDFICQSRAMDLMEKTKRNDKNRQSSSKKIFHYIILWKKYRRIQKKPEI